MQALLPVLDAPRVVPRPTICTSTGCITSCIVRYFAPSCRSLMPRVVCLVAKLAELPPAPEQRRTLALELGAGAMELLLGGLACMHICTAGT